MKDFKEFNQRVGDMSCRYFFENRVSTYPTRIMSDTRVRVGGS